MGVIERRRRFSVVLLAVICVIAGVLSEAIRERSAPTSAPTQNVVTQQAPVASAPAIQELEKLQIKGRAPKTGYSREQFSNDWGKINGCSLRELILLRDLQNTKLDEDGCRVLAGTLQLDPYTGKTIDFQRGATTSQAVQIDHVVAVSDAWQKGAQQLSPDLRYQFYNDPLNLLAVDGPTNNNKGDGDAATWLPPNKDYRCRYVARQIAVKIRYTLWVTQAEYDAIKNVLGSCPAQVLPIIQGNV
jgi:hypothetical protein